MGYHDEYLGPTDRHLHARCAPSCDDQLPNIATVGRGLKGDSYQVRISEPDTVSETHLEGWSYDDAAKRWAKEWVSENVNGGNLSWHCNLRPFSIPQCFTMTFIYARPGRPEWSATTPAIPYVWDSDGDGNPDVDQVVGSGVGNLWIRESPTAAWKEALVFPTGTTASDFNAPAALEAWSGNITFGYGGDIELPNLDDVARILGWTKAEIEGVLAGTPGSLSGTSDNVKDYIDDADKKLQDALDALEESTSQTADDLADLKTHVDNFFGDLLTKIYGGGTVGDDGHITWPNTDKIALGNINVFTSANYANYIKTAATGDYDLEVQ